MPLPLADLTLFRSTTTPSLRAPMKIAEAGPGKWRSPTRASTRFPTRAHLGARVEGGEGHVADALVALHPHVALRDVVEVVGEQDPGAVVVLEPVVGDQHPLGALAE
jgi:hypothetical protein